MFASQRFEIYWFYGKISRGQVSRLLYMHAEVVRFSEGLLFYCIPLGLVENSNCL